MTAGNSFDDDEIISEINVTPLVDIMLVLLIIFMLTANIINSQAIKVDLPKAATGESSEPTTIALTLKLDGTLFINGEAILFENLSTIIAPLLKKDPKTQAIIAADKKVSHGQVIKLIDSIRILGLYRFALNIDPLPKTPPTPVEESFQ